MKYNDFISEHNLSPDSYIWVLEENLENKRSIYYYDFCVITTPTIYTLITDDDPTVKLDVGSNIDLVDYSGMSLASISNTQIRELLYNVIEVSDSVIKQPQ